MTDGFAGRSWGFIAALFAVTIIVGVGCWALIIWIGKLILGL